MSASEAQEVVLARIDERQKSMGEAIDEIRDLLAAQNGRMRSLESWHSTLAGAVAILSILVTFALSVVARHL